MLEQAVEIASAPPLVEAAQGFLVSSDDDSKQGQPVDLPSDADGEPTENDTDDRKALEDSDDETDKLSMGCSHEFRTGLDSKESLLAHLQTSVDQRTGVSLIILHHSWKSFIYLS